ncbi:MAG: RNA pseudouridine synthase [Saprospiraceae bacterium]|nr:RNA pseudouridine synthase [Bacteroidia bacterium]NNE13447.1 RNA pseudouridine synthase [Saprospiraceae bacterium]NNL93816.1 RNA pseudouridine synthase [Saprospiraceae bacterium]
MDGQQKVNPLKRTEIIENQSDYLIVNKPAGILSQSGINDGEPNLLSYLQKWKKQKFHLLSRLDRPVSGLTILSKTKAFNRHYQSIQESGKVQKTYIALVEGLIEEEEGTLNQFLCHDKRLRKSIISNEEKENYDPVSLEFKCLAKLDRYSIIATKINTGKFHQIRSQLSSIGYPIKGDVKYGARRGNKDRSINLHSYKISFKDRSQSFKTYKAQFPKNDNLWNIVSQALNKKIDE